MEHRIGWLGIVRWLNFSRSLNRVCSWESSAQSKQRFIRGSTAWLAKLIRFPPISCFACANPEPGRAELRGINLPSGSQDCLQNGSREIAQAAPRSPEQARLERKPQLFPKLDSARMWAENCQKLAARSLCSFGWFAITMRAAWIGVFGDK